MLDTLAPRVGNPVQVVVRDRSGSIKQVIETHNLRTTAGATFQKNQMSGSAGAVANYIGISNDGTAPAAGDTVMAGEQTTNGLARAVGTFDGNAGPTSYTLTKQFTYTGGSPITLTKAGMFNAASAGSLVFEALFGSSATLVNGDQITVVWTVNI